MDFSFFTVLIFAMVAIIGVIAIIRNRQIEKEWREYAASRGWHYTHRDRHLFKGLRLDPFGRGSSRQAKHVLVGKWSGIPVRAFTYVYTTGSGDDRTTHSHSVVQFESNAGWPALEVYNGWRLRLTKDIQFESDNFNKQFDVRGPDHRFAFDFVHPRFMAALLDGVTAKSNLSLENGVFTLWRKGSMRPNTAEEMLAQLVNVLELVPDHVWHNGQVRPPALNRGS